MSHDGKDLEGLVELIESLALPDGFNITRRHLVRDENGELLAELDLVIEGVVGVTSFKYLIECRDRPSAGSAPGSWIEQLAFRKTRFDLDRVIAVSTTGFSASAEQAARKGNVELRRVETISDKSFDSWLKAQTIEFQSHGGTLHGAELRVSPDTDKALTDALAEALKSEPNVLLVRSIDGQTVPVSVAFQGAVNEQKHVWDEMVRAGQTEQKIILAARYGSDDHFIVMTYVGPVRIAEIVFEGTLRLEQKFAKIKSAKRYSRADDTLAQAVDFEEFDVGDTQYALSLYRVGEDGPTHVLLHRTSLVPRD
jgi:hypothetical protein